MRRGRGREGSGPVMSLEMSMEGGGGCGVLLGWCLPVAGMGWLLGVLYASWWGWWNCNGL